MAGALQPRQRAARPPGELRLARGGDGVLPESPRCNALGVCDVVGQVWEWTSTDYREAQCAYVMEPSRDPPVRPVHKGGSWQNHLPFLLRHAKRGLNHPDHGLTGVGFRCVRSL
jgi:sulfatase modifying factor 1